VLLTLAALLDDVRDELPSKEQAPVVRAVNKVVRRLHTELVGPERSTFTTRAVTTTGTVAVTEGSTAVTFSSGVLLVTDPLRLVRVEGEAAWFALTRNAADTAGVLSSAWPRATDAAAAYEMAHPTVTLPAAVGEVTEVRRGNAAPLGFRPAPGCPSGVAAPATWGPWSVDSSAASPSDDLLRVVLDPAPLEAEVFSFWYRRRTPALSPSGATTQTVPFSDLWYEAVVQGTLFHLWRQEGDRGKSLLAGQLFEAAVARARGAAQPAAVLRRRRDEGLWTYEQRPLEGA
jgi:hypothetical protein